MCLAGYVCCRQEGPQSLGSDQVSDLLSLSQQLAGGDTVRLTRQPVQVTPSDQDYPQHLIPVIRCRISQEARVWGQVRHLTEESAAGDTRESGAAGSSAE